ncbi:MAG: hypothetical protein LAT83_12140 [Kiritimatiellae bacterium]|nr:hypothetical protein [Kiritimatiellia bacterium]
MKSFLNIHKDQGVHVVSSRVVHSFQHIHGDGFVDSGEGSETPAGVAVHGGMADGGAIRGFLKNRPPSWA